MAAKTDRALQRLINRLSALRQTLRKDERELLDKLIMGATAEEVAGHKINVKAADKANPAVATGPAKRANMRANVGAPEVAGHAAVSKANPAVATKANPAVATGASMRGTMRANVDAGPEVAAHSMVTKANPAVATKANPAVATGASMRIDWDTDKKQYRINVD